MAKTAQKMKTSKIYEVNILGPMLATFRPNLVFLAQKSQEKIDFSEIELKIENSHTNPYISKTLKWNISTTDKDFSIP